MGTTAEKLQKLISTKAAIKTSLENKGLTPTDKFDTYPALIDSISGGGSGDVDIDFMFSYEELFDYIKTSSENEKNIVMFNYVLISSVNVKYNTNFKLNNEEIKFICRMFDIHYLTFLATNLIEKRKKHEKN